MTSPHDPDPISEALCPGCADSLWVVDPNRTIVCALCHTLKPYEPGDEIYTDPLIGVDLEELERERWR